MTCLVVNTITQVLPSKTINVKNIQIPQDIELADPQFHQSSDIDILLGAEVLFELMCLNKIKLAKDQPVWQKTLLGWVVSGVFTDTKQRSGATICNLATNEQLNANMAKF